VSTGERAALLERATDRNAPADVPMAARLRLVVGRLNRRMRAEGSAGLSHLPLSALVTVERFGPLRLGELAVKEGVSAPTMSRALAALDERGAVERTPDPADARSVLLTISPSGRTLLAQVRGHYTESLARLLSRLDEAQLAAVEAALPALEALLGDDAPRV
jgi:DNA-binding MarR family transcriptional regulator